MGAVNKKKENTGNVDFYSWYLINIAKVFVVFSTFYLFLKKSWVGEDAFIFFRYVDSFVSGNGLVFNIGERVEGFTSPLWIFVLSFIRGTTHWPLRPTAIILGLVLSTTAVALLIYERKPKIFFPLVVVLLITTSAFRDFATSGFETSLTYLLLVLVLIAIRRDYHLTKPVLTGTLLSLLVLNRPESILILFYILVLVVFDAYKSKDYTKIKKFILPALVLLGGYQLFRMGYFASLFPNTFYAKRGGSFYFTQGFYYSRDFVLSYPFTIGVYLLATAYTLINVEARKKALKFLVIAGLLLGYVLYAGGDYMHGRSLLMAFIVWSFALIESLDALVEKLPSKLKMRKANVQLICLVLVYLAGAVGVRQVPLTIRTQKAVHNIEDERSRFGYNFDIQSFKDYVKLPITYELGWTERGLYYREVAAKLGLPISVVNANIGYFGYAGGKNVSVMGGVLVDPYLARLPLLKRGKIGHENDPSPEYVYSRRPTFAYTPFKYWNTNAHFKWDAAPNANAIVGDSNDSFVPVFDLSNTEFINGFSILTRHSIKSEVDGAQRQYLEKIGTAESIDDPEKTLEYLGFLRVYWYPYASQSDKDFFDKKAALAGFKDGQTIYEIFYEKKKNLADEVYNHIKSPMSFNQFMLNIGYSLKIR